MGKLFGLEAVLESAVEDLKHIKSKLMEIVDDDGEDPEFQDLLEFIKTRIDVYQEDC